jgi:hypothetical protein
VFVLKTAKRILIEPNIIPREAISLDRIREWWLPTGQGRHWPVFTGIGLVYPPVCLIGNNRQVSRPKIRWRKARPYQMDDALD